MCETPLVPLRDVSTHIKDGTHGTHKRVESGVPLLSAKNVGKNGRLQWDKSDDLISEADYAVLSAQFTPRANDLLLTVVGSIGRSALFDGARVAFQRSVAFVRCTEAVVPAYVTAQAGLYLGELAKITVPFPSRERQEEIARVLASIDTAIERTEALIAKQQQIKAGLMHDLFTRGLTDSGAPRPTHTKSANRYKETSIGWIPAEWSVDPLGTQVEIIDPNPSHRYPDDVSVGVPICSTENFAGEDDFDLRKSKLVPMSAYTEQEHRCRFKPTDVVFARKGRIGLARRYGHARKAFSHTVVLLKPKAGSKLDANWLLWAVRSHWFLGGIERTMNSNSGVPTLGVDFIAKVEIPFPPLAEQSRATKVLDQVSNYIRELRADLDKLHAQKSGLLQDLLTGKVEVALLATEATNA